MSLSQKTKNWIRKKCVSKLNGKTVVVTGANSGVGLKEAETLVYLGADVIMACRNLSKAKQARQQLLMDYPKASIDVMELDIASLDSIDRFVETLKARNIRPDGFVNNAGIFHQPGKKTRDGFELVMGTNYIGTYYLSEKMVPYMAESDNKSRFVNTISIIHKTSEIDYEDFYCEKNYGNFRVYGRSKICLAKYTYALSQRYKDSNVCVLMNHPGISITPLGINAFGGPIPKMAVGVSHLFNSPEKSALSVVYIMSTELEPGTIVGPNKLFGGWGYPQTNHVYRKVKNGGERLIDFTNNEIDKVRGE